jgi:hypothetical protein
MIGHAFTYLSEYGQSDYGVFHQETSNYIYGCSDVGTLYFGLLRALHLSSYIYNYTPLTPVHGGDAFLRYVGTYNSHAA